jgi:hypothetical protein
VKTVEVRYLVNANLRNKYFGWQDGDQLIHAGTIGVEAGPTDDGKAVCEKAFAILNRDDRPFGRTAPSLSVGDVLALWDVHYACEPVGFRRVEVDADKVLVPPLGLSCADVLGNIVDELNRELNRPE